MAISCLFHTLPFLIAHNFHLQVGNFGKTGQCLLNCPRSLRFADHWVTRWITHPAFCLGRKRSNHAKQITGWFTYLKFWEGVYLHKSHVRIHFVTVPSGDIFVYIKISALAVHREQISHPGWDWYPELTRIAQCLFVCWDEALCFICVARCMGWDSAPGWNGGVGI